MNRDKSQKALSIKYSLVKHKGEILRVVGIINDACIVYYCEIF